MPSVARPPAAACRLFGALALAAGLLAPPAAAAPKKGAPPKATPELAKALADGVRLAADERLLVRTNADLLPLAELLGAEASRRGASVVLQYTSPVLTRAALTALPDASLERAAAADPALPSLFDAVIELGGPDDPAVEAGVDAVRLVRAHKGRNGAADRFYASNIRRLVLGRAAFPTDATAKFWKADAGALAKTFWDAVAVKEPILMDRADRVAKVLGGLKIVRITTPGGTDLELRLAARPLILNTGLLPELAPPGIARETVLPAGDVTTVPTEFYASGLLVADAVAVGGVLVRDVRLGFQDGKARLVGGGDNFQHLHRLFDLSTGDKAVIGRFSIGVNEASKPPAKSLFRSPEMAGAVTIGIGANKAFGGFNSSEFEAAFTLLDATVEVREASQGPGQGITVVEKGVLKVR